MTIQQLLLGAGGESVTGGQTTFIGGRGSFGSIGAVTASASNTGTGSPTIGMGQLTGSFSSGKNNRWSWVCPTGVNYVTVLCVGGGGGGGGGEILDYYVPYVGDIYVQQSGGGGGGGGLIYANGIAVTPGTTYYVGVGYGPLGVAGDNHGYRGGQSYFATSTQGSGSSPSQPLGSYIQASGGQGGRFSSGRATGGSGNAVTWSGTSRTGGYGGYGYYSTVGGNGGGGGGGCAGLSGNGGNGSSWQSSSSNTAATAGSGGGGGGGGGYYSYPTGGGGINYFGVGANGAAGLRASSGTQTSFATNQLGQPGSQGALGSIYNTGGNSWSQGVVGCSGGIFGGGGGGNWGNGISSPGSPGFVRILWDSDNQGTYRAYPSTNVGNMS